MSTRIFVTKSSGEEELFSEEKVLMSMKRVGISENMRGKILSHIEAKLYPGIKTSIIFDYICEYLKTEDRKASIRINLKKAIFDFGPTGFPFEKYVAKIFESKGYSTSVDLIMAGECINHEVDVVIEKNDKKEIIEVKFHNMPGIKTDCHVALYTYARFLDLKGKNNLEDVWIITNTKLSQDAKEYALCKGIKVISWNYPDSNSIQSIIEKPNFYPITILDSLTREEKTILLENNIVMCVDLLHLSYEKAKSLYVNIDRLDQAKEDFTRILGEKELLHSQFLTL